MKVLSIGNSFAEDAMEYLYQILQALGEKDIKLAYLFIGGCSIDKHVENAETSAPAYRYCTNANGEWVKTHEYKSVDALRSDTWDYIGLQQASRDSGLVGSYANLPKLMKFARENGNKGAKVFWQMTWAYAETVTSDAFGNYDYNQEKMYRAIVEAVKTVIVPQKEFAHIIPTGTAIQNARTSYLGDTLNRDGVHLSIPLGRYLAGLVWARTLTGKSVRGISYAPEGVDEEMKKATIEAVEAAIQSPFEITKL